MTIGIYCIENKISGKKYIGKSKNIEDRFRNHKWMLRKSKHHNDYLQASYDKYNKECFEFYILETLDKYDAIELSFMEMKWIDHYETMNSKNGYNLLYDSPGGYVFHEYVKKKRGSMAGEMNPNFGNNWTDAQKSEMSEIAKQRHASGDYYDDEWRKKIGTASKNTWSDLDKRSKMAQNVSKSKTTHDFYQYTKHGGLVNVWYDINHILRVHNNWKWQNIYAACNGSKKSYMGFVWKRVPKKPWAFHNPEGLFDEYEELEPLQINP